MLLVDMIPIHLLGELWLFKMSVTLIAAVSDNNVIGLKGGIPWHIPEDVRRFKGLTLNHPVIMGRKTYESLPEKFRPLPQRKNIVISNSLSSGDGIYVARNIDKALELAENVDSFVIGGEKVYRMFLPIAERLEITRVHRDFEGDRFFPEVDYEEEWDLFSEERGVSENKGIQYSFLTYLRK